MSDLMVDGVDIKLLNDEILFAKLVEVGYTPGPIVDSTRSVYQRKLAKILRNEDDDDDESDEGERDVATKCYYSPYQSPTSGTFTTPASPYSFDDLRRRPLPRSSLGYESSPMTSSFKRSASPSRLTSEPAAKSSSISITVKLVILIFVALFAFVVYQNMESVTTNPVPEE